MLPAIAAALGAFSCMAALGVWSLAGGGELLDAGFVPTTGSRLVLGLDPLAAPLAVFMTGVAAPILFYAGRYLGSSEDGERRSLFFSVMPAFVASMVLLVLAQDLLVLFVALELTAIASYLLIRDDCEPEAERAAGVALIVTLGSSLFFVAGALLIAGASGTTVLSAIDPETVSPAAAVLMVLGVLGKSAQVPLHFWLPRAMVAPTPVSAYLHSAALVAAGVFVLMRVRPLIAETPAVLTLVWVIGAASIAVGAVLALVSDELKRILAYSTIAQYGYAMVMIGLGGAEGAVGAVFFIVAHGLAKSALFLTAGAVTHATHEDRLSKVGGLAPSMPLLAIASAVAAAALAGLPLTVGYFKDELFFATAVHEGRTAMVLAASAAAATVAYTARFWLGIFAGRTERPASTHAPSPALTGPVAALAIVAVVLGVAPGILEPPFVAAGSVVAGEVVSVPFHYSFELRAELVMALVAWGVGVAIALFRARWRPALERFVRTVAFLFGPAAWADRVARVVAWASNALHDAELRDLRDRVGAILLPSAALIGIVVVAHGLPAPPGPLPTWSDAPLIAALVLSAVAAIAALWPRTHHALVLQISFVGFALALAFTVSGAPDVAIVLVAIETMLTVLFLVLLRHIRRETRRRAIVGASGTRGWWLSTVVGVAAFVVGYSTLASQSEESVAQELLRLTPEAHAKDAVTAILADFRGLDTAGELTVLVISILGAAAVDWGVKR